MNEQHARFVTVGAALVVVLGSVSPWITMSGFFNLSVNGTAGDGKITLAAGLVTALLALAPAFPQRVGLRVAASLAGLVAVVVGVRLMLEIDREGAPPDDALPVVVSAGWGLWAVVLGGLVLVAAPWAKQIAERAARGPERHRPTPPARSHELADRVGVSAAAGGADDLGEHVRRLAR